MAKPGIRMSTRQVTPRFWENLELADLERDSGIRTLRLTMIGLWAAADEAGIFEWEPRRLAGKIYPYNPEDQLSVAPALEKMLEAGFVKKVEVANHWYGYWPHWGEHNKFRRSESRYPEAAAILGYPREGQDTPHSGRDTPFEVEVEEEVRSGSKMDGRDGEAETPSASSSTGQETSTPSIPPESSPVPTVSTSEDSAARLAKKFFKLLGQPKRHVGSAGAWELALSKLLSEYKEEDLSELITFALEENDYSIEYLLKATDPMATFVKNHDTLAERREEARRIDNKLAKAAKTAAIRIHALVKSLGIMSRPSLGMSESPIPGRSGATTVNLSVSFGINGLHIREVCV